MMKRMTKNLRALSALGMRTTMMLTVVMMSMFASPYGVWAQSGQAVATVLSSGQENPVEYTDLEAAFAAAKNNDEMKLLADCALAADSENGLLGKLVLGNGTAEINVVLDLNGHTISGSADELITVTTNAYLTITDRSADGKGGIVTTGEKAILNVGILAVIGGSVSGKTCGIYSRGTSVNIGIGSTGCAGTISGSSYGLYIEQGVANISGGNFVATGTGGIGIECANSTGFYFLGLPTFNCTVADISLAKDQKIEFADGSYAAPTNKIKVKVANTAPYIFTMVYGRYVKNADGPFDPEAVFEYYDATAGLSFKLVDNGDYGTDVQIYQKDPLSGKRIAVIADPHVMPASLLTDANNTDWKTYLAGSRKLVDYSQTLFDQTVATLKSDKPELVLIVGDLTKDGEQASHNYLKGKLDELKAASIPTLVIPGNHDLGSSDAKIYGKTTTAAPAISQSDFAQLYQDYGYGSTSERESTTSLTYACEPITGLVVIGIDSGEEGQLSESTLTWVCNKAVAARSAGKQVIAMMHHPLIPHITGGEAFVSTVSVADYATVRNRLADAGISVVFTGHFHTSDIARDWNGDKKLSIYDVTTGSLCSYPCDYRIVTFNDALTQMQIDTQSITSAGAPLGGGDNFTTAIAKTRLSKSMENILKPRLTAKLVASGTSELAATLAVSMIAPSLVEAYIYHTEGDEHENSAAQSLLSDLNSLLANYPAYKTMASSMLEDKSNYGTDRVDQTNDRSLSVSIERAAKSIQSLEVTIAQGPFIYTGQEIKPAVTVKDGEKDVKDFFDITYESNVNAGTAKVTVTAKEDQTKYTGSASKTFTIKPAVNTSVSVPVQQDGQNKPFYPLDDDVVGGLVKSSKNQDDTNILVGLEDNSEEGAGEVDASVLENALSVKNKEGEKNLKSLVLKIVKKKLKGKKIKICVVKLNKKGNLVIKVKGGKLKLSSSLKIKIKSNLAKNGLNVKKITIKNKTRGNASDDDDLVLDPNIEYEILDDCDLVFTVEFDDDAEEVEIEGVILRQPGDANGDDKVDAADIVEMVNAKEGKPTSENFSLLNADINEDGEGEVDQNDIDVVVDMIMEPKDKGDE